jgi:hypothetical protein
LDLTAAIAYYSGLTFTSLSGSSANLSVLGNGSTAATYTAGNYSAGTSMDIPTSITLDAQGNPNAIFVFMAGSTLTLESGASVLLVNGAQADNVFWVVGISFTSVWNGVISNMVGTIMAADSITLGGGTLIGRALAQTAAVTLSTTETITVPIGANAGPAVPVVFSGIADVNVVEWAGLTLAPPTNFGTAPSGLVIGGNVSLFAGYTALVVDGSGNLKVDIAAGAVTVAFPSALAISGAVSVTNFPAVQPVSFSGSVTVGNFPAIQPISGSVTALISGSVTVGNFPTLQNVDVTEWDGIALGAPTAWGTAPTGIVIGGNVELFAGNTALVTDASGNLKVDVAAGSVTAVISGSVTVGNFPAIQPISGSVAVTNFPAIQPISGSVTALISGSVTVGNFPALQNVNVAEWDGLVLAPPTKFGTVPSGLVIGGNVDIFAGYTALVADGSGNLMVNVGSVVGSVTIAGAKSNNYTVPDGTNLGVLPALATAVSPLWTEGDQVLESVDLHGGQRTVGGNIPEITAAWTSATAVNTVLTLTPILGYATILVTLSSTATISSGVIAFEASDTAAGAIWYAVTGYDGSLAVANFSPSVGNQYFQVPASGFAAFRARLSAVITGTGTVSVGIQACAAEFALASVTEANLTAVRASVAASAGPASGLMTLVKYNSTAPSLTTGQTVAIEADYAGSLFIKPYRRSETVSQATTIASSAAATTVLAAQAAGIFADISTLVITATAALTTDLQFTATLSDGTASYIFDMETGTIATPASPLVISFNPPLSATTAATAWTIALSVATVTVHITVGAVLQKAS